MHNVKIVLESLKGLLESEELENEDIISIYELLKVTRNKYSNYKEMIDRYDLYLKDDVEELNDDNNVCIHGFDYDTNRLNISFKLGNEPWDDVVFFKDDEKGLYIEKSKNNHTKDLFASSYRDILNFYNEFLKYRGLRTQSVYEKKSVNSNFEFDTSFLSTTLRYISGTNIRYNEFELSYDYINDRYEYDCNSSKVLDILKNHEKDLLKKIFVKIEDCPEWTREILYDVRKKQLVESKKQQKKLEFRKKIFPWIK